MFPSILRGLQHRSDDAEGGAGSPSHSHSHSHHHPHVHSEGVAASTSAGPRRLAIPPEAHRDPLERGAGRGKLLYLDAFSGLAGDMFVAALVDLGVPWSVVEEAVATLKLANVSVSLHAVLAGSLGASKFEVTIGPEQPQRNYAQIRELLAAAALAPAVRQRASAIFARLAQAEAAVHRVPIDDVHFHEVGAADALADIVGAAACLDYLDAELLCSALPLGRGWVDCQHGRIPIPAPATLGCLQGMETLDAEIEAELVTPTGAAIVGSQGRSSRWPAASPIRIGYGSGSRTLADRPNLLRAVLLTRDVTGEARSEDDARPTHVVVETNLDDSSGELLGHVIAQLLDAGAVDAWATPAVMKKGRPAWTLSALCKHGLQHVVADVVLRETSAIGVRFSAHWRTELPRKIIDVTTDFGVVPVKVSGQSRGPIHAKPEFEVCRRLAAERGVPLREVMAAALLAVPKPGELITRELDEPRES